MAGASRALDALRVLVVDDEEDMRALVKATIDLTDAGLSVAGEAVDGADAIAKWHDIRPDVVLLDQRMPKMTGLEAARRILAEDPDQAVALLTAYPDKRVQVAAEHLGVRACMSKNDMRLLPRLLRTIHNP